MLVSKIYKTILRTSNSLVCIPNCRRCTMLPQSNIIINIFIFFQSVHSQTYRAWNVLHARQISHDFLAVVCIARALSCWKCLTVVCCVSWSISAPLTRSQLITGTNHSSHVTIFFFIWGLMVNQFMLHYCHQLNWSVEIYSIVFKN